MRHIYLDPAKRVAAGAKFLDEQEGGIEWAEEINLEALSMRRGGMCVLGQLESDYCRGLRRYDLTHLSGSALGFDLLDYDYDDENLSVGERRTFSRAYNLQHGWAPLQEAWHFEIATRQATLAERERKRAALSTAAQAHAACGGASSAREV